MDFKAHKSYGGRVKSSVREEPGCTAWASLLPDAVDGVLSEAEELALNRHLALCQSCASELAEAKRGLAWLGLLKDEVPEPPENLLANILAQTTGYAEAGVSLPPLAQLPGIALGAGMPAAAAAHEWQGSASGWRQWISWGDGSWAATAQPRLAMTAAMAFFSICVTLNLLSAPGDRLSVESLSAGGLHRTVADTGASLIRSIQGLRVVYRVESRVSEMRAETNRGAPQDGR